MNLKVVALSVAFVLVPVLTPGGAPSGHAQEVSPAAAQAEGTPLPVRSRGVASAALEVLTPGTANLVLGRLILAPGATLPLDASDPSASLVYVQSGELSFRVASPMSVTRDVTRGTPAAAPESVDADADFTLSQGDSAVFPPAVSGEVRNDGDEEAVAWVVSLAILTQPEGTPAASTPSP